jgi:hypothetical protein
MDRRSNSGVSSALVGVLLLVPAVASAQSMTDAEKIRKLERQTELLQQQSELLQRQLKEVKEELARTRQRTETVEAKVKAAPVEHSPRLPASATAPITKAPPPPAEKVKVTVGGFIAAESVWRQRNEVADMASNFGGIPYPFSPLYNENEFHASAR